MLLKNDGEYHAKAREHAEEGGQVFGTSILSIFCHVFSMTVFVYVYYNYF